MEELRIQKTIKPYGFGRHVYSELEAVKFENGKIAYLDTDKEVKVFKNEANLQDNPDFKIVEPNR